MVKERQGSFLKLGKRLPIRQVPKLPITRCSKRRGVETPSQPTRVWGSDESSPACSIGQKPIWHILTTTKRSFRPLPSAGRQRRGYLAPSHQYGNALLGVRQEDDKRVQWMHNAVFYWDISMAHTFSAKHKLQEHSQEFAKGTNEGMWSPRHEHKQRGLQDL